jgi:hypothetical protein
VQSVKQRKLFRYKHFRWEWLYIIKHYRQAMNGSILFKSHYLYTPTHSFEKPFNFLNLIAIGRSMLVALREDFMAISSLMSLPQYSGNVRYRDIRKLNMSDGLRPLNGSVLIQPEGFTNSYTNFKEYLYELTWQFHWNRMN